jgi:Zn-dependent protease with chaperone function
MAITAVVAAAYCIFVGIVIAPAGFAQQIARCQRVSSVQINPTATAAENLHRYQALVSCIAPAARQAGWELLGGLIVLALALAAYIAEAERRMKIKKLSALKGPVADRIRELSEAVGLRELPRVLSDPGDHAIASVFGRPRRPLLAIGTKTIIEYSHNPSAGDAIILHELAHIANGDIRRDQFAGAILKTIRIIGTVFVPVAVAALLIEKTPVAAALGYGEHAIVLLAVYYWAHRGYVRNRELHADFRAQLWSADDRALADALRREFDSTPDTMSRWNPIRLVRAASAMHPPIRQRPDRLTDASGLLQFTAGAAVFSGIAAGMLASLANLVLTLTAFGTALSADAGALSGTAGGCLLGACLAAGLARNSYIHAANGDTARLTIAQRANRYPAVLALAASAGVVIGGSLPFSLATSGLGWSPDLQLSWQVVALLAGTLVAASLWNAACLSVAFRLRGTRGAARLYRIALAAGAVAFGSALTAVYGISYSLRAWGEVSADRGIGNLADYVPGERNVIGSYLTGALRSPLTYALLLVIALALPWMLSRGRTAAIDPQVPGQGHDPGVSAIIVTPPALAKADYEPSAAVPVENRNKVGPADAPRHISPTRREAAGSLVTFGLVAFLLARQYGITPGTAGLMVGCAAVAALSLRIEARANTYPAWTAAAYGAVTCCLAGTFDGTYPGFAASWPGPFFRWLILATVGVVVAHRTRGRSGANLDSVFLFMALLFAVGLHVEELGMGAFFGALLLQGFRGRYTAIWGLNSLTGALVLTLIVPPFFHSLPVQAGVLLAAIIACPVILCSKPARKILGVTIVPRAKRPRPTRKPQPTSPLPAAQLPGPQASAAASASTPQRPAARIRDLSKIPLSDITQRALAAAAQATAASGTLLDTSSLLLQLIRLDMRARWDRICLTTGGTDMLEERRVPDEIAKSQIWHEGAQLTVACAKAMATAENTRRRYGFESLPAGVLALSLVADAGNGAARTLGVPERISHHELSEQIQRDIVGSILTGWRGGREQP